MTLHSYTTLQYFRSWGLAILFDKFTPIVGGWFFRIQIGPIQVGLEYTKPEFH